MFKQFRKYIAIIGVFSLLVASSATSFAEEHDHADNGAEMLTNAEDIEAESNEVEDFENQGLIRSQEGEVSEEDLAKKLEQDEFLSRVKRELNLLKVDYRQVKNSLSDTEAVLNKVNEDKLTLEKQLANLDNLISTTTEELLTVIAAILEKENAIRLISEEIEMRELALQYQKDVLEDYIAIVYSQERELFKINDDGSKEVAKLLLAEGDVGKNLRELDYFDLLNESSEQIVEKLDRLHKELKSYQADLERHKENLSELKTTLSAEKSQLELQQNSKKKLLQITLGQEEIYNQLLAQSLDQQEEMLDEIRNLNDALEFIEYKIEEEGLNFNPSDYEDILDYKAKAIYNFHKVNLGTDPGKFIWPMAPDKGISAYFKDPGYRGVFGVQHKAIDLPAYQGTPMRAAADGVVYAAKDNGYGYSYIILAHAGSFQTVYGHVNKIMVEEGELVRQGEIIGLSGGMPGTKGAGYMTTGPHLHFEMLLNGTHVDPLNYLSLKVLTKDQVDWLPDRYKEAWERSVLEAVRRIKVESESEEK